MTMEDAIQAAEKELQICRYHEEVSMYPGIRAMYAKRGDWLSWLLTLAKRGAMAEDHRWIPVTERMPKMKEDVQLYFRKGNNQAVGFLCEITDGDWPCWCTYSDDGYYTDCIYPPTHWKPLDASPEVMEDG